VAKTPVLPLALGAAALLLIAGKKKSGAPKIDVPELDPKQEAAGSGYKNVTRKRMQQIQAMLHDLGYSIGASGADGKYGPKTKAAVKSFQADYGLSQDGKPGPNTQAKLEQIHNIFTSGGTPPHMQGQQTKPPPTTPSPPSGTNLNALPAAGSTQVVFNLPLTEYDIGATWRISVLDKWLNQRRTTGWLATVSNGAPTFESVMGSSKNAEDYFRDAMLILAKGTLGGWGALGSRTAIVAASTAAGRATSTFATAISAKLGASFDDEVRERTIRRSGAFALTEFVSTHSALVGLDKKSYLIKDLPRTDAVVDFLGVVSRYIARFQASEYT
jgi:hypothetical protein